MALCTRATGRNTAIKLIRSNSAIKPLDIMLNSQDRCPGWVSHIQNGRVCASCLVNKRALRAYLGMRRPLPASTPNWCKSFEIQKLKRNAFLALFLCMRRLLQYCVNVVDHVTCSRCIMCSTIWFMCIEHGVLSKVYFLKSPDPLANSQRCR